MNSRQTLEVMALSALVSILSSICFYFSEEKKEQIPSPHLEIFHVEIHNHSHNIEEFDSEFDPELDSEFDRVNAIELYEELSIEQQLKYEYCTQHTEHGDLVNEYCYCGLGYSWCNPENPLDLSCCENVVVME